MAFTEAEKTDIRRFCGYPVVGAGGEIGQSTWHIRASERLEFRMNHLSDAEAVVARRYIGTLTVLEHAVPRSGDNLDTDQASVWTRNRDELRDRLKLFEDWRRRLCGFLGVPPGPAMTDGGLSLVV